MTRAIGFASEPAPASRKKTPGAAGLPIARMPQSSPEAAGNGTAAHPCPGAVQADGAHPTIRPGVDPVRVLMVEDHADTSRALARLLRRAGHAVTTAESVAQAIDAFSPGRFDLLVSDLGLPDGSGLELMRRLKDRQPGIFGICLSGYGTEADVRACRESGFAEHLTKPVDMNRLNAAVARIAVQIGQTA